MNALLALAKPLLPLHTAASFQVLRSAEAPHYYQLSLRDAAGEVAHWVIPVSLKHAARRPLLVWRLAPHPAAGRHLTPIDGGLLQLAACQVGAPCSLSDGLARGLLRLRFQGEVLHGYFRLQCLPLGGGQLWQFIPMGQV
jgi:hypothetical protein